MWSNIATDLPPIDVVVVVYHPTNGVAEAYRINGSWNLVGGGVFPLETYPYWIEKPTNG